MRKRIAADPKRTEYMDRALAPVHDAASEDLDMFCLTDAARKAVDFAQTRAAARARRAEESA